MLTVDVMIMTMMMNDDDDEVMHIEKKVRKCMIGHFRIIVFKQG